MADQLFTIPAAELEAAARKAAGGGRGAGARALSLTARRGTSGIAGGLVARFEDDDGQALGKEVALDPPRIANVEFPNPDGSFGHEDVAEPVAFAAKADPAATRLAISSGGRRLALVPLGALGVASSKLKKPRTEIVGPAGAAYVVPVVSERFTDFAAFIQKVRNLRDYIVGKAPFNAPAVAARFALKALYWQSADPANGLFNTGDGQIVGNRFHGDRALARKRLKKFIAKNRPTLILINSTRRGGAGGTFQDPTWVSITGAPNEDWRGIALHEIGHALGLADEYVDLNVADSPPAKLEPNVSETARAGAAPWAAKITVPSHLAPSHPVTVPPTPVPPNVVGTFEGARYRNKYFRPAATCMMRVAGHDFCPVCQDHIRSRI